MNIVLFAAAFITWELVDVALGYIVAALVRRVGATQGQPLYIADPQRRTDFIQHAPAYLKSTLHALIVAIRGSQHLVALWNAPARNKLEIIKDAPEIWSRPSIGVVHTNIILAGYLASDLLHVILSYPHLGEIDTVLHHVTFLACAVVAGSYRLMPFVFGWLIVGEFSTPILNLRWFLIKLKKTTGTLFLIVESGFGITFIITRLFIYGAGLIHFFWMLFKFSHTFDSPKSIALVLLSLVTAGFILNMVWLAKIVRAFKRSRRISSVAKHRKSN